MSILLGVAAVVLAFVGGPLLGLVGVVVVLALAAVVLTVLRLLLRDGLRLRPVMT